MANMSYCRFENTNMDLLDCINAIGQALDDGKTMAQFQEQMSSYEKIAMKQILDNCHLLIEYIAELEQSQGGEE